MDHELSMPYVDKYRPGAGPLFVVGCSCGYLTAPQERESLALRDATAHLTQRRRAARRRPPPDVTPSPDAGPRPVGDDLVGLAEVAMMAGVRNGAVGMWRRRDLGFPEPLVDLQCGPIWWRPEVVTWLDRTGRTSDADWSWRQVRTPRGGYDNPRGPVPDA